jgi:hypothetical protein
MREMAMNDGPMDRRMLRSAETDCLTGGKNLLAR